MKIIVTGATGLVGAEVVRQALLDNDIQEITALVRRPLDIPHLPEQGRTKLKSVIHNNFLDYSAPSELLKTQDACLVFGNLSIPGEQRRVSYHYL